MLLLESSPEVISLEMMCILSFIHKNTDRDARAHTYSHAGVVRYLLSSP